jgi:hypothetical protein
VVVANPVRDTAVIAVHVDEPAAAPDVRAVLAADDDAVLDAAIEAVTERDLLWYAPQEIRDIPRV